MAGKVALQGAPVAKPQARSNRTAGIVRGDGSVEPNTLGPGGYRKFEVEAGPGFRPFHRFRGGANRRR